MKSRRQFLVGAAAFLAAPAIVRAESIMPVRPVRRGPLIVDPDSGVIFDHGRREIILPFTGSDVNLYDLYKFAKHEWQPG